MRVPEFLDQHRPVKEVPLITGGTVQQSDLLLASPPASTANARREGRQLGEYSVCCVILSIAGIGYVTELSRFLSFRASINCVGPSVCLMACAVNA